MSKSAALIATAGTTGLGTAIAAAPQIMQYDEARKARKLAEQQLATEKEALAGLLAEQKPVVPLPDDQSAMAAKKRSITAQMRRRGRSSTILTDTADSLGAG